MLQQEETLTKLTLFILDSSIDKLFFLEVQKGSSLIDLVLLQEETKTGLTLFPLTLAISKYRTYFHANARPKQRISNPILETFVNSSIRRKRKIFWEFYRGAFFLPRLWSVILEASARTLETWGLEFILVWMQRQVSNTRPQEKLEEHGYCSYVRWL